MALYDFYCKEWRGCYGKVEAIESIDEPSPRPKCPKCGSEMNNCSEHFNGGVGVAFNGLSTPGSSMSRKPELSKALKDTWRQRRIEQVKRTGK